MCWKMYNLWWKVAILDQNYIDHGQNRLEIWKIALHPIRIALFWAWNSITYVLKSGKMAKIWVVKC